VETPDNLNFLIKEVSKHHFTTVTLLRKPMMQSAGLDIRRQ
jgi:hypothetical protein